MTTITAPTSTPIKQIQIDSTDRIVMYLDNETILRTGFTQVTDAVYASILASTHAMYYVNGVLSGPSYTVVAASLANQVDSLVADIYAKWTRFSKEYTAREAAATAYKAAGYTGDISVWISSFATPAGLTPKAATDLILSQSATLNGALSALGALRMRKYEILNGPDLATVQASYADITSKINAIATQVS